MAIGQELLPYVVCTECKQWCPSVHPRFGEWLKWHAQECRPKPRVARRGTKEPNAEPYAPWLAAHIKMTAAVPDPEDYDCVLSDQELEALIGRK